jgi:hypothetical protein
MHLIYIYIYKERLARTGDFFNRRWDIINANLARAHWLHFVVR